MPELSKNKIVNLALKPESYLDHSPMCQTNNESNVNLKLHYSTTCHVKVIFMSVICQVVTIKPDPQ